jgi:hypothetical protein
VAVDFDNDLDAQLHWHLRTRRIAAVIAGGVLPQPPVDAPAVEGSVVSQRGSSWISS